MTPLAVARNELYLHSVCWRVYVCVGYWSGLPLAPYREDLLAVYVLGELRDTHRCRGTVHEICSGLTGLLGVLETAPTAAVRSSGSAGMRRDGHEAFTLLFVDVDRAFRCSGSGSRIPCTLYFVQVQCRYVAVCSQLFSLNSIADGFTQGV